MKKAAKVFALLGVGTLFIGIFICIAGFAMGGRFHSDEPFRGWLHQRYSDYGVTQEIAISSYEDDYSGDYYNKQLDGDFDTIDLNMDFGNCYIQAGNTKDGCVITGTNLDDSYLDAKITSSGVLEISYDLPSGHNGWNQYDYSSDITISIPEKEYKKVIMELNAGDVTVENLSAARMELKVEAGELYMQQIDVSDTCVLDVKAGSIQIESFNTKKLEANCEAGSIDCYDVMLDNAEVNCETGSITLDLRAQEQDYNYTVASQMGSVTVDGTSFMNLKNKRSVDNGADKTLNFDCELGNIEVYFD